MQLKNYNFMGSCNLAKSAEAIKIFLLAQIAVILI
jgi:hypothetical protein